MVNPWNRLEDLHICGLCRWVRKKLERMVKAEGSNPAIKLSRLVEIEIHCHRAGVIVKPLDQACGLWQPTENKKPIIVEHDIWLSQTDPN